MALSTTPISVPPRATQLEIDALSTQDIPAGSSIYNTDTNKMNVTALGGLASVWDEAVVSDSDTITVSGTSYTTPINTSLDTAFAANVLQVYSPAAAKYASLFLVAGRGTKDAPQQNLNGDTIGRVSFLGVTQALTQEETGGISGKVSGTITATDCPVTVTMYGGSVDAGTGSVVACEANGALHLQGLVDSNKVVIRCQDVITGYSSLIELRSDGGSTWAGNGVGGETATISFTKKVDIQTDSFRINSSDPFVPIFATVGHTSAIQVGTPTFTTPIAIAYGGKAEGTWTKIIGMSSINVGGAISFSADTITVLQDGDYQVSVSTCLEVDVNAERISLLSIGVNQDDTDKVITALTPSASASESDSSKWTNISVVETVKLVAADTLKFFYSQTNESGITTDNVNLALIRIDVRKLGKSGV